MHITINAAEASTLQLSAAAAAILAYVAVVEGRQAVPTPQSQPALNVLASAGAAASATVPAAQSGSSAPTNSAASGPATPDDAAEGSADPSTPVPSADARGLPWDKRIHSTPASTTADGNWRKKRNVAEELVATVEAELRGAAGGTQTPPPPPPAETAATPAPPAAPATTAAAPAAPPPPPAGTAAAAAGDGDPSTNFEAFMKWIGGKMGNGALQFPVITEEAKKLGLGGVADIRTQPHLVPMLYGALSALSPD